MKEYDIYVEGYICNGGGMTAKYIGSAQGKSFKDACKDWFYEKSLYNERKNTFWGCGLFETLEEAQKTFG